MADLQTAVVGINLPEASGPDDLAGTPHDRDERDNRSRSPAAQCCGDVGADG